MAPPWPAEGRWGAVAPLDHSTRHTTHAGGIDRGRGGEQRGEGGARPASARGECCWGGGLMTFSVSGSCVRQPSVAGYSPTRVGYRQSKQRFTGAHPEAAVSDAATAGRRAESSRAAPRFSTLQTSQRLPVATLSN